MKNFFYIAVFLFLAIPNFSYSQKGLGGRWGTLSDSTGGGTDTTVTDTTTQRDFFNGSEYAVGSHPCVVASADIDNDGDIDLVVSNWYDFHLSILLNNGDGTFAPQLTMATLGQATYLILTDLNNDSKTDIVIASSNYPTGATGSLTLYLGNGDGTFGTGYGYVISQSVSTACAADLDNDGDMDLACTNWYEGTATILLNNGSAMFNIVNISNVGAAPYEIHAADFDNDGLVDLAIANTNYPGDAVGSITILKNNGGGNFSTLTTFNAGIFPQCMVAADIDHNGTIDLVIPNRGIIAAIQPNPTLSNNVFIYSNDGSGNFTQTGSVDVGHLPVAITQGDFNNDDDVDVLVTNSYTYSPDAGNYRTLSYLMNDGTGTFTEESVVDVGKRPSTATRADLDGDGYADLAATSWDNNVVSIVLNEERQFRTFKASSDLAVTPTKMVIKNGYFTKPPNTATMMNAVYSKIPGKEIVLGIPQTTTRDKKLYSWVSFPKATDFGKFFVTPHSGTARPLDSVRLRDKVIRLQTGLLRSPNPTKYNNPALEQGAIFKLNLYASQYGYTPHGFGSLVIDTPFVFCQHNLKGMTLTQVGRLFDSAMTYWKRFGLDTPAGIANLNDFVTLILKRVNNGFSTTLASNNYKLNVRNYLENKVYPVNLKGQLTASNISILRSYASKRNGHSVEPERQKKTMPVKYFLSQNYPNPFNPTTTINISIPEEMDGAVATLKVYNSLGQEVSTLLRNEEMTSGVVPVEFNAANFATGAYFYRLVLNNGEFVAMKKMMLLK